MIKDDTREVNKSNIKSKNLLSSIYKRKWKRQLNLIQERPKNQGLTIRRRQIYQTDFNEI